MVVGSGFSRRSVGTLKMKKRKYYSPPVEVQKMFSTEWRRAKHILTPMLDRKRMPKLYMATGLNGATGWHLGRDGMYALRLPGQRRFVRSSHLIALKEGRGMDEMRHTVRHEIVHTVHQNHGPKFQNLLRGLERARKFEESLGVI